MESLYVAYAVLGTASLLLALVSRWIDELPVSEPLVALLLGIVLGPQVLGLLALPEGTRETTLLELSRLLLAVSVMAAALRFPATDLRSLTRAAVLLLAVVMPVMAVVAGAGALLLGLPLALAAVVGACVAPTDPVLAGSVVSGDAAQRDLPARVRAMLTVESGANDGLALPLVALAAAVAVEGTSVAEEAGLMVWSIGAATVLGLAVGAATGAGVRVATRDASLGKGPELVLTLVLAVAVLGLARVVGSDGVLAVFVAGLAYNRMVGAGERGPQEDVDEAVNTFVVLPLFLLLGIVLPWSDWADLGPAALGFVAVVLLLRRLPAVLAGHRLLGLGRREGVFAGWFGPIGVSAIFYLAHSGHEGVSDPRVFAAGTLAVTASIVAFGITSSPGRQWFARSGASEQRGGG